MLEDLDETIRQLMVAEMPINNGDVDIKFHQPKREWSSKLTRPTINFFLYDLRENEILRRHQWDSDNNGHKGTPRHVARIKRSPFRLDCHYMITVWATEPEDEHQLLSGTLLALFRFPVLPAKRLVGALQEQPYELKTRLAGQDKLTNPAEVWGALDNEIRPSISYIVTLAFDPWLPQEVALTKTFTLRTGQSTDPHNQRLNEDGLNSNINTIKGFVMADDTPQVNLRVSIKGTSYAMLTDKHGRFAFSGLPNGEYTLMAWQVEDQPVEKAVSIPNQDKDQDYDISL